MLTRRTARVDRPGGRARPVLGENPDLILPVYWSGTWGCLVNLRYGRVCAIRFVYVGPTTAAVLALSTEPCSPRSAA